MCLDIITYIGNGEEDIQTGYKIFRNWPNGLGGLFFDLELDSRYELNKWYFANPTWITGYYPLLSKNYQFLPFEYESGFHIFTRWVDADIAAIWEQMVGRNVSVYAVEYCNVICGGLQNGLVDVARAMRIVKQYE